MKTKLLYEDSYLKTFQATIIEKTESYLVLDQTLFFPTKAGQYHDEGDIEGIKITDVLEKEGVIYHYLDTSSFKINQTITGNIDFEHRFTVMQNHTGEHILSGLVNQLFHLDNIGFHLSNEVTVDYNGKLNEKQIKILEEKVNQVIYQNLEVKAYYLKDKDEITYRSKKEIEEDLRIVEIPGIDRCACCAPHVHKTGEIGLFVIKKVIRNKKGTRLIVHFGKTAYQYLNKEKETINTLYQLLSSNQETLVNNVENLIEQNKLLEKQVKDLQKQNIIQILKDKPSPIIEIYETLDQTICKDISNELLEKYNKTNVLFVGNDTQGYRFIMQGEISLLEERLRKYQYKGKGMNHFLQGFVKIKKKEIEEALF